MLGVKVSSDEKGVSECLEEMFIIFLFIVMFWGAVDRRDCYFSYVVFKRDAGGLYIVLFMFRSCIMFNVLSDYNCGASACCFVGVSGVIYIVIWYFHVTPFSEVCSDTSSMSRWKVCRNSFVSCAC